MDQPFKKHIVLILTRSKQNCMNNRYGKECKRKVNTGFCWQHYPQICKYHDPADLQICVWKLMNLSRLSRKRNAKISIVQALFEVVSNNKWYLFSNPEFYQIVVHKYAAYKEICELAQYSYLEQPLTDSKWSNELHYWAFPTSKRKPKPNDTCYC